MSAGIITQGWGAGLAIPITVALPPFPFVPKLPGVPQLPRSLLFPTNVAIAIAVAATSGALWQSTQSTPVWGVFDSSGQIVVNADSVQEFGWRKENRMPNFPIQQGQFSTYNRIGLPFEASITLTKGGSEAARSAFLAQCDTLLSQSNIALYTIRTPEKTYQNVSVSRGELSRRGVGNAFYFDVELFFQEITQVTAQYSSPVTPTANAIPPSAVPPVNQGLNNPLTPSTAVQTSALQAVAPPVPTG